MSCSMNSSWGNMFLDYHLTIPTIRCITRHTLLVFHSGTTKMPNGTVEVTEVDRVIVDIIVITRI